MQDGNLVFHKKIAALREETGEQRLAKAITTIMKLDPS